MKFRFSCFFAAVLVFLASSAPCIDTAPQTVIVDHDPSSNNFHAIQPAIDRAAQLLAAQPGVSVSILVKADKAAYTGTFFPIGSVPIIGESTSGTFISGAGTLADVRNATQVTIRNFTFQNATVGISVANSSSVHINNIVFQHLGTGVQVTGAATSNSIVNNTFYNNQTAISTNADIQIENNIFSSNTTAVDPRVALTQVSFNDYFPSGQKPGVTLDSHSIPNPLKLDPDPRFVDPIGGDFHLQSSSPCIDAGDPSLRDAFDGSVSDMGAYGGPTSDMVSAGLSAVTGLTSTVQSPLTPPTVISLSWSAASGSAVTGYRVYYGTATRNYTGTTPPAEEGASGFTVSTTSAKLTFTALPAPPEKPATAPAVKSEPRDKALFLSWSAVPGATGYRVYYSTAAFQPGDLASVTHTDVGSTPSFLLSGLTNGVHYFVRVSALAQSEIFAAVTAVVDTGIASSPGSTNESSFSNETSQRVGPTLEGPVSAQASDFPEATAPFPNLKSQGCFIATAAYGFYSAPQVQALREFRDRYLMTNAPGRAFVAWYYRHGPAGARFLNEHPWLKVPVRVALFPLLAVAAFLVYLSPVAKTAIIMILVVAADYRMRRAPRNRKPFVKAGRMT